MPAGRPRKPTALKQLEGDQPCRINVEEPTPAAGPPVMPLYLDDDARAYWRYVLGLLEPMKVATSADSEALAILCTNFSTWKKARAEVSRDGLTVTTQFSYKPHPMLAVISRCEATMGRILGQFGMTPASRAALGKGPADGDDEFIRYLKESHGAKQATRKEQAAKAGG